MKKYWKSLDEQKTVELNAASHVNRKSGNANTDSTLSIFEDGTAEAQSSRRNFLKIFGFSIASAAVAASCEQPVRKAIPYLIRPEEITPGVANYYASSFFDGDEFANILVKVRDGRPIKIEGNELSALSQGATSAKVQASVLSLYDDARYQHPSIDGKKTDWENFDSEIIQKLEEISKTGKQISLITPTIVSPSTKKAIEVFIKKYPSSKHIQYDAISASGILEANKANFNKAAIPTYDFSKAQIIVGFDADFLGSWLSPVEFTKQYSKKRDLFDNKDSFSRHYHFEAGMSLTGSNADKRFPIKPSEEKAILVNLYNKLASQLGQQTFNAPTININIDDVATDLLNAKGQSMIVSGSNDTDTQIVVNAINFILGNYGKTININKEFRLKQGIDSEMTEFVDQLERGEIGAVLFYDTNPIYNFPDSETIKSGLVKLDLSISLSSAYNETAHAVRYISAGHHFLESWEDYEIRPGEASLAQPVIKNLFNTRQAQESLLRWAGIDTSYQEFIQKNWSAAYLSKSNQIDPVKFWNQSLHDGVFKYEAGLEPTSSFKGDSLSRAMMTSKKNEGIEVSLYQKTGIGSGNHTNNPWLQELPDPVTKATWDNYACVSPSYAKMNDLKNGDLIVIDKKTELELPVLIQAGQAAGTISIALGYGRQVTGKVAENLGKNAFQFVSLSGKNRSYSYLANEIEQTGRGYQLALTQTHDSMEGRAIIREASFKDFKKNPAAGNELHEHLEELHTTIYNEHEYKGHHWGMAIDLSKCVGCSACVVACGAENNIPVVGKNEVVRAHEMHWLRIDRYYNGDPENPETVRQPVMCQHCDNAPCENVCPVAATNHSDEGINQMAYNRCIGTRYCNNNCPYKVRRFNWYDYTTADAIKNNTFDPAGMTVDLKRMVLNPDVTVRSKGVIEKCSFCVQRIQEKKLTAKLDGRKLVDGEIKTACQQSCPADAIVFGDMNDPESKVSKMFKDQRNYHLLEELHTLPSVGYLTKIRNNEA